MEVDGPSGARGVYYGELFIILSCFTVSDNTFYPLTR